MSDIWYNTNRDDERNRLMEQASYRLDIDEKCFEAAVLHQIQLGKNPICICELGGSNLFTRIKIFRVINNLASKNNVDIYYYNLEHNQDEIEKARSFFENGLFDRLHIKSVKYDLNEASSDSIIEACDKRYIDFCVSSYVIQHIGSGLDNPDEVKINCLEQVGKCMNKDSDFYHTCPDDSLKGISSGEKEGMYGFSDSSCQELSTILINNFLRFFPNAVDRFYGPKLVSEISDSCVIEFYKLGPSSTIDDRRNFLSINYKWYYTELNSIIGPNNQITIQAKNIYDELENVFVNKHLGTITIG